jgi:hypothetical protein
MTGRVALAFVAGAVLGTALDQIHVHSGLTYYTHPVALGAAWWVPLVFGSAAVLLALVPAQVSRAFLPPPPARLSTVRAVLEDFILFVAAYFATGLLAAWPRATLLLLVGAALARLVMAASSATSPPRELAVGGIICLTTAIVGPLVERLITLGGGFGYTRPAEVFLWLPPLYLFAGLLGRSIGRAWFGGR